MREWLILGVLAVGGILGLWLLIFKALAALYELWQSGREFDQLKREAASRRMQRPSELMEKQRPVTLEEDSEGPVVPQSLLDSLSDDQADPRLVPQRHTVPTPGQPSASASVPPEPAAGPVASEAPPAEPAAEKVSPPEPPAAEDTAAEEPTTEEPPAQKSTTYTPPPPTFPLPPAKDATSEPPAEPNEETSDRPPRYDG